MEITLFQKCMVTLGMALVPVIELRGAIPAGIALGLPPLQAFILAVAGNMLPVPFIILFIRQIFVWLKRAPFFVPKIEWLENHAREKSEKVHKYRLLGLMILVAIPLPGTGAWTGALVAALLDLRMRHAVPAIFCGVVIAGVIVTAMTLGIGHLFF